MFRNGVYMCLAAFEMQLQFLVSWSVDCMHLNTVSLLFPLVKSLFYILFSFEKKNWTIVGSMNIIIDRGFVVFILHVYINGIALANSIELLLSCISDFTVLYLSPFAAESIVMATSSCLAAEVDHMWLHRQLQLLRISPPSPPLTNSPPLSTSYLDDQAGKSSPKSPLGSSNGSMDPLMVQEVDLERRCLGTLTDAVRSVVQYAHSSFRVPISFQVKRFDRAQGQIWVKVSPEEVPEGYDLKYLLQHIKFYENIPRYARLLNVEDYKLKATCQYFLDLQSRPVSAREEGLANDIGRLRETINRASKFVHEMISVGIMDRDVVHQLSEAQSKLGTLNITVDKFSMFQQNRHEMIRMSQTWCMEPEKQHHAARQIHQQMSGLLEDPDVAKYVIQVVGPRLGIAPMTAF